MKPIARLLILMCLILFAGLNPAKAQTQAPLTLRLQRNFGYSAGSQVQGTFTLRASGPPDLTQVRFYIDDQLIGQASTSPYELRFNTDSYPVGEHTLTAVGMTSIGDELRSNSIRVQFVSAEEGWQAGMRLVVPLLALVGGAVLLAGLASVLGSNKLKALPPGAPRRYGIAGGAICSRCSRPFSRHFFSPNLVFGKLERCPFCGKWGILPAAPSAMLRQAEEAERDAAGASAPLQESDTDRLQKELDESRYQDL